MKPTELEERIEREYAIQRTIAEAVGYRVIKHEAACEEERPLEDRKVSFRLLTPFGAPVNAVVYDALYAQTLTEIELNDRAWRDLVPNSLYSMDVCMFMCALALRCVALSRNIRGNFYGVRRPYRKAETFTGWFGREKVDADTPSKALGMALYQAIEAHGLRSTPEKEDRNYDILLAYRQGATVGDIAKQFDITPQRVSEIIRQKARKYSPFMKEA